MAQGIVLVVVGLAAIVWGLTAREFHAAFMRRPGPHEKPMPKWLGRTIFLMVGGGFIYSGLSRWLPIQVGPVTQGVFLIVVGLAAITYDFTADRFSPDHEANPRARWAGRIVTFVIAVAFLLAGISYLRRH